MRELKQNWLDLFSAFRIAADPKKMLLGFVAVVLSVVVLWVLMYVMQGLGLFPLGANYVTDALLDQARISPSVTKALVESRPEPHDTPHADMLLQPPMKVLGERICFHLRPENFGWPEMLLIVVGAVISLLIWAFFGGAIARGAAVEFCRDDRVDVNESTSFAKKKYWGFFWAPLVPLIGIVILKLCIWVTGALAGLIPWVGPILFGLFFFLVLLAAFLIVLLLLGGVFGLPLMFPTVAVEGTDAFDAVSRAFSYVYGRPWKYIWYKAVSIVYGAVCILFVVAVAVAVLYISFRVAEVGMGAEEYKQVVSLLEIGKIHHAASSAQTLCGALLFFWSVLVGGTVIGFCVSMCLTLDTIVYCLLRKDVDGTDMSEVYLEEEDELPVE